MVDAVGMEHVEIRRLTTEERLTRSFPLQAYAFEASPATAARLDEFRDYLPYTEDGRTLVAEEGRTALATVTAIPMRQNVRGTVLPMAGVAAVATHPLARRQGHVRTLLTRLLGEMRDEGCVVSALYPFRPSFYARFGYAGLPKARTVGFSPAGLAPLVRADLPGDLRWQRIREGYPDQRALTERLLADRHGFAIFPASRAVWPRDTDERWSVTALVDGEVAGVFTYRISDHGGTLAGDDLLTTGPLGRTLLLQFLARHVDQVDRVTMRIAPDETPELWGVDFAVRVTADVHFPTSAAPMARLLSLDALRGLAAGPGRVVVELVDDPFLSGRHLLDGTDGRIELTGADPTAVPAATLTAAGLSALVYGVLDPVEVVLQGLGAVPDDAAAQLRTLFPRRLPHLYADF
ncbi:GNAT family N-acetyltransferase [Micromonospora zhanjiangensis]|uniref:Enhanced intracellular survival protein Eis n=1 Tax=Micromonospora zhanjiangensis TaxID=1522057 RepID=A0ABV8KVE4_9ACTN